jgi:hypothetical protein
VEKESKMSKVQFLYSLACGDMGGAFPSYIINQLTNQMIMY